MTPKGGPHHHPTAICGICGDRAGIEEAFQGCSGHLVEECKAYPPAEGHGLYRRLYRRLRRQCPAKTHTAR